MGSFFDFLEVPQGGAGARQFMHYKIRGPWVPPVSWRRMSVPMKHKMGKEHASYTVVIIVHIHGKTMAYICSYTIHGLHI